MGAIFGTGTNAAYLESLDKINTVNNRDSFKFKTMVVNTLVRAAHPNSTLG